MRSSILLIDVTAVEILGLALQGEDGTTYLNLPTPLTIPAGAVSEGAWHVEGAQKASLLALIPGGLGVTDLRIDAYSFLPTEPVWQLRVGLWGPEAAVESLSLHLNGPQTVISEVVERATPTSGSDAGVLTVLASPSASLLTVVSYDDNWDPTSEITFPEPFSPRVALGSPGAEASVTYSVVSNPDVHGPIAAAISSSCGALLERLVVTDLPGGTVTKWMFTLSQLPPSYDSERTIYLFFDQPAIITLFQSAKVDTPAPAQAVSGDHVDAMVSALVSSLVTAAILTAR